MNMTLKARLITVIGFLSLLSLAIGLTGLFGMRQANEGLRTVYEDRTVALAQISTIDHLLQLNRTAIEEAMRDPVAANIQLKTETIKKNAAEIDQTWTAYMATYLTPEEKVLADKFTADRSTMLKDGLSAMVTALKDNKIDVATKLEANYKALYLPVTTGIEALQALQVREAKKEYDQAKERYATIQALVIIAIIGSVLIAGCCAFFLIRSVYRQLGGEPDYALEIVRTIASGDLTVQVATRNGDRHSLLFAMHEMQLNLATTVGDIRQSTDTIATASGQIATGNLDLSSRTEQQASALEETASSMEELTSTVKQNADNARQANQLAVNASDVAVKGGAVVSQVVTTMGAINESARKIADIIGVIDGIAFQTNILALNAAVEAARAGEQGRGFAVVASEVRSLAQRSASAAKEIKELINDSVEKVDAGTRLVDQAGATMTEVVASVRRVTDIIGEITAASQEQTAGIDQINQAIMQMDDVTQQNAALVEQAAAAAASLQDQAGNLVGVVSVFKTAGRNDARVQPPKAVVRPDVAALPRATQKRPAVVPARQAKALSTPVAAATGGDWEEF
ncbi:methyl-accepting chemotaxis protein [Actimicrobium antarcticum]|uniref:Methyl-accepting chemotaxis protein n=1 Tax=Actimicrobium antarcticum TaxID=1051899 RepID=A0ABP7TL39_9BURK